MKKKNEMLTKIREEKRISTNGEDMPEQWRQMAQLWRVKMRKVSVKRGEWGESEKN